MIRLLYWNIRLAGYLGGGYIWLKMGIYDGFYRILDRDVAFGIIGMIVFSISGAAVAALSEILAGELRC